MPSFYFAVQISDIRVLLIPNNWRYELSKSRVLACELIFPMTSVITSQEQRVPRDGGARERGRREAEGCMGKIFADGRERGAY